MITIAAWYFFLVFLIMATAPVLGEIDSHPNIFIATRIHLGKQSNPPSQTKLESMVSSFLNSASTIKATKAAIAVDSEEKIKGYDLVSSIKKAINDVQKQSGTGQECEIVEVNPWGNFVNALNALTSWACRSQIEYGNSVIMFISAETSLTKDSVDSMMKHMDDKTLVVGAALPGHDYQGDGSEKGVEVALNGRTCCWNTLAMWNLEKLALTGFPLLADGLHRLGDGAPVAGGIEEVSTVLIQQRIHPTESKAKLVKIDGVEWEQKFEDEERKKWHEVKMNSKYTRAEVHRSLLGGIEGTAIHI